jgi:hypothetical protein
MAWVNASYFDLGIVQTQASWTQTRQTSFMSDIRQWIQLVSKLRERMVAKEATESLIQGFGRNPLGQAGNLKDQIRFQTLSNPNFQSEKGPP